jgi:hypothetical protein
VIYHILPICVSISKCSAPTSWPRSGHAAGEDRPVAVDPDGPPPRVRLETPGRQPREGNQVIRVAERLLIKGDACQARACVSCSGLYLVSVPSGSRLHEEYPVVRSAWLG